MVAGSAMAQRPTLNLATCTHVLLTEVTHHMDHGTNVPNLVEEELKSAQGLAQAHPHNLVVKTVER